MLDVTPSETGTTSALGGKPRPRLPRRRILLLSGCPGVRDEFVTFVDGAIAEAIIEHAPIPGAGEDAGEEPGQSMPGGSREAVFDLVRRHGITDVTVEWPRQAPQTFRDELCDCLLTLKLQGVRVHELSHFCERVIGRLPLHDDSARGVVAGSHYHFDRRWQAVKRACDVAAAASLLALGAPLLLVAAAAIRVTSLGPILYRQDRVGLAGRTFRIAKFRSMRVDAEKDGAARFATRDDERITPVGRILRNTHIDELPQLWNVLAGDMSLVGPRPERPVFVEGFKRTVPFYDLRHRVKPGITGWAQVKDAYAASEAETRSKLSRDLYYIKRGSLWMDLKIMAETAWVMITRRGSR
jgi:exopolysaccharide biosynthesis polyprenyl glycosylphosphotransferase